MITRCPACSTAFNVNSQQLASARGAVRCGSCLQVFKATDHIVFDGLQQESEPRATETHKQESSNLAPTKTEHRTEDEPASTEFDAAENPTQSTPEEDSSLPSWDQYPEDSNPKQQDESNTGQEFEELASDMDDDPFLQVDQELAEQLDQELEAAFATDLDIEPPSESQADSHFSSFGENDLESPVSEISPEPNNSDTSREDSIQSSHSDFFEELSELAEQSLEEATKEETQAALDINEADLESSHEIEDNDKSAEDKHPELNIEATAQEDDAQSKPDEPRFTDDDTEHFKQKPETNRSLPQAFSPELPEESENDLDESWALDMMMKELDGAEDLNQPSKIEQVLDGRTMEESSPLEDILNDRPAPDLEKEEHPEEVELGGLDLSSELEDALSMDSIESGNLSLAADSEFNLEQDDESYRPQDSEAEALNRDLDEQESDADSLHSKGSEKEDSEPELEVRIVPQQEEPSKAEMIDSIEPEPLEMEFRQEKPNWNWLWGSGVALALLAAIGQFAWIKFDDLNRQPPYRDYYQIACNILSCSLPPQIDLSKLKASNLVVRSHPETEQALVVDMVLLNLAQFEQEFPDIQLTFSDIQGKALASRVFRPSEYLAGELAGASRMPIQRPIHLSLDIVDPGNEAVNYKVDVR
ncbi:DUF3426 domain-containing protein [Pseudoteredinibacter isoporae]|uniref:Putative Zn finger-like uncharacterized protein n=1 Tax=Pseudoteredinibacter isoporae TaxID=570281 RepID=A0A7X0JRK8_9GAMM|nr:DUF3426 domain-containing protein [Pseudoteredinibacter isoporae]MBB6520992.1 putative Zn finger-like uncharacterized protein [Pseudoteredinibacter isoporae]NHO86557.1 DUF3426 domain-containing protein [Pseudoteredinibacter isoporae]NIB24991.1 DUF3426 domain-containing protein [Pseudoteredinibacter isoporae]